MLYGIMGVGRSVPDRRGLGIDALFILYPIATCLQSERLSLVQMKMWSFISGNYARE